MIGYSSARSGKPEAKFRVHMQSSGTCVCVWRRAHPRQGSMTGGRGLMKLGLSGKQTRRCCPRECLFPGSSCRQGTKPVSKVVGNLRSTQTATDLRLTITPYLARMTVNRPLFFVPILLSMNQQPCAEQQCRFRPLPWPMTKLRAFRRARLTLWLWTTTRTLSHFRLHEDGLARF